MVQWLVQAGDAVAAGDVLVIVEAMKMEHEIRAPQAGRCSELFFHAGETVNEGDVLGTLSPLGDVAPSTATSTASMSTPANAAPVSAQPPAVLTPAQRWRAWTWTRWMLQ